MQDCIHCNGGNFRAKLLPKASMYTSNILCLRNKGRGGSVRIREGEGVVRSKGGGGSGEK